MVMFHCYVSLPEGKVNLGIVPPIISHLRQGATRRRAALQSFLEPRNGKSTSWTIEQQQSKRLISELFYMVKASKHEL